MDPSRFYGKHKDVLIRAIPEDSDDSELSSEDDEIDETWIPEENNESDSSISDSDSETHGGAHNATFDTAVQPHAQLTKRNLPWRQGEAADIIPEEPVFTGEIALAKDPQNPIDYFREIIDEQITDHFVTQSNIYSAQSNINQPLNLNAGELEQFIGVLFMMSIVQMPKARCYWGTDTRYDKVANIMSEKRFHEIKGNLHCSNNNEREENCTDKLFKVPPFISLFNKKGTSLVPNEKLSIDEQMVPFKGRSSLKQYNPKKPKKWGYKIFVCCSVTGVIHNFEFYTVKILPCPDQPDIGASGNIVLRVLNNIPRNVWHNVYFDNWFNSTDLQIVLWKQGIAAIGTVRSNRLKNCIMPSDKDLLKNGRGSATLKSCNHDGVDLFAVKWFDNRAVTTLSTYAAIEPIKQVKRWDKKAKQEIQVNCPSVIMIYNKFMGGVDLLDSLLALYRIPVRYKKWYHCSIFHFLDMAVVQAWLVYRADCSKADVEKNKVLALLDFQTQISICLMKEGKIEVRKRGRPSLEMESQLEAKKHRGPTAAVPPLPVRADCIEHFPEALDNKGRCKRPGCKGYSRIKCEKCNVHLCLTQKSNCFKLFHQP